MEICDLFSMETRSQAWCYLNSPLLPCLLALCCHPYSQASGLRSPGEGKEVKPRPHTLEQVSGEAALSARGLRSCPRFMFSIFERQRQQSHERCCQYFSTFYVIIAVPSPRSFLDNFPPVLLSFSHYILIPWICCVSVCVQRFPGESQTSAMAEIFLVTLSPRTSFYPLEVQCHASPMENARLSSFIANVSDESHSATSI